MKTLVSIAAVMMLFVSSANAYTAAADPDLIIMAGRAERQIQAELAWLDKFGMVTKPGKVYEILDRHYGPVNKLIRMRYIHPDWCAVRLILLWREEPHGTELTSQVLCTLVVRNTLNKTKDPSKSINCFF